MALFDRLMHKLMAKDFRPPYESALDQGDEAGAIRHLLAAVRGGDAHAMVTLGTMLLLGRGIEQDSYEGIAWVRQGAIRGDTPGMVVLAAALARGTGCTCDEAESAFWYYRASLAGSREAVEALGQLLLRKPSLIGVHFTQEQYLDVRRAAHRVRVAH